MGERLGPGRVSLVVRHIRAQNRIFWRVPIGAFFALFLPVMMLVLFVALFGSDTYTTEYGEVSRAQFYTPALAVFAVASATFTNLAINLSIRRDEGILREGPRHAVASVDLFGRRHWFIGLYGFVGHCGGGDARSGGLRSQHRIGEASGDAGGARVGCDDVRDLGGCDGGSRPKCCGSACRGQRSDPADGVRVQRLCLIRGWSSSMAAVGR